MKNTTKWKSTLWVCLLLLTGSPGLHAQQEPNAIHDMHAKGWLAIIEGDNARDRGKKAEANSRYESALNIYRDIQKEDATFQKEKIAYRITYCKNQLAALNGPTPDTVGSEDFKKKYATLLDETKTLRQRLADLEAKQEAGTPTSVEATEQLKKQNIKRNSIT